MRRTTLAVVACWLLGADTAPVTHEQQPLEHARSKQLKGKFLQITDLHPDPFYKYHSSVEESEACHRGSGPAGAYGAEGTDCDSPFSLVNATFKWIEENIRDEVDFVIWTGDSARHDNDEVHPRDVEQITRLNRYAVSKFYEVWGKEDEDDDDPLNDLKIPVVPTWGNNDVLPHNIFERGPNRWTKQYLDIWRNFIPEAQRHGFAEGGSFYVEVIPNQLAVFSLNSLYFFGNNVAVDGCAKKKEPGYQLFEWLRIQLNFLRQRGMKAILIGHVPPARTDNKQSWDETCWQKYTLWNRQYRDVIIGSLWGHMNIDHFMLQDFEDIDIKTLTGEDEAAVSMRSAFDDEISIQGAADYLTDLRYGWSDLPDPPKDLEEQKSGGGNKDDRKRENFFDRIGGKWGERFSLSLVSPSVVPNYFPTLRIFEYNITGIENLSSAASVIPSPTELEVHEASEEADSPGNLNAEKEKRKKFKIPRGPSKSSPPGPAYSPQTLSWLNFRTLYANLTVINNDFVGSDAINGQGWSDGKHPNERPDNNEEPNPQNFTFQLEYDTHKDDTYKLKDLTVRNWVKLAARIGRFEPDPSDSLDSVDFDPNQHVGKHDDDDDEGMDSEKKHKHKHKKHKHKKGKKRHAKNKVWFEFVKRAFVGSRDEEDLHETFGQENMIADSSSAGPPSWADDSRWTSFMDEYSEEYETEDVENYGLEL